MELCRYYVALYSIVIKWLHLFSITICCLRFKSTYLALCRISLLFYVSIIIWKLLYQKYLKNLEQVFLFFFFYLYCLSLPEIFEYLRGTEMILCLFVFLMSCLLLYFLCFWLFYLYLFIYSEIFVEYARMGIIVLLRDLATFGNVLFHFFNLITFRKNYPL